MSQHPFAGVGRGGGGCWEAGTTCVRGEPEGGGGVVMEGDGGSGVAGGKAAVMEFEGGMGWGRGGRILKENAMGY